MQYNQLNSVQIAKHVERLERRINISFADLGLARVSSELSVIANTHINDVQHILRPRLYVRLLVLLVLLAGMAFFYWLISEKMRRFGLSPKEFNSFEGVEAIVNLILLTAAGIWFLINLETRARREAVLKRLHEFRSIAHVIDMCQLAKTSNQLLPAAPKNEATHDLSARALVMYLQYCSEMLSLVGKLAALYMPDYEGSGYNSNGKRNRRSN